MVQNLEDFIEISAEGECWRWTGPVNQLRADRPTFGRSNASRAIWIAEFGEPPVGWHVEHTCETNWCVNLAHLDAVPPKTNYDRLRKTTCKRGHDLTDAANVASGGRCSDGYVRRKCRVCRDAREAVRVRGRQA